MIQEARGKVPLTYDEFIEIFKPKIHKDKYDRIGFPEILGYEVQIDDKGGTATVYCPPKSEDFPDLGALVPPFIGTAQAAKKYAEWREEFESGKLKAPGKPYFLRVYDLPKYELLGMYGFWTSKTHTGNTYEMIDNRKAPGA